MEQYIDKAEVLTEVERRKNQFISQAESFHKIGMEDKGSYYAALASNMNSLSCFIDTLEVIKIGVDEGDPKGDKSAKYILDTKNLEVKEVDLDKEVRSSAYQYDINNSGHIYWEDIVGFAKHFFELGLKAQKGE